MEIYRAQGSSFCLVSSSSSTGLPSFSAVPCSPLLILPLLPKSPPLLFPVFLSKPAVYLPSAAPRAAHFSPLSARANLPSAAWRRPTREPSGRTVKKIIKEKSSSSSLGGVYTFPYETSPRNIFTRGLLIPTKGCPSS